jgi:hypothetical protein
MKKSTFIGLLETFFCSPWTQEERVRYSKFVGEIDPEFLKQMLEHRNVYAGYVEDFTDEQEAKHEKYKKMYKEYVKENK